MTTSVDAELLSSWRDWHAAREADLATPHGWLSIVDLLWLGGTPATTPAVPGAFSLTAEGTARYAPDATAGVTLSDTGLAVTGEATADGPEGGSDIWLRHGTVVVELIRRSGRLAVRLRDSAAPGRLGFTGVPAYQVDPAWVLDGVFRSSEPQPVTVGAAAAGLHHVQTVVGTVDFEIGGVAQRLRVVGGPGGRAQLVFHDPTNDVETAPWRALWLDQVHDGPVTLDFNRTLNLPFAFSVFGTCPRPADGNVVTRAVTAGEKAPA